MSTPAPVLHFSREEYAGRVARASAAVAERGLDGMLLFIDFNRSLLVTYTEIHLSQNPEIPDHRLIRDVYSAIPHKIHRSPNLKWILTRV